MRPLGYTYFDYIFDISLILRTSFPAMQDTILSANRNAATAATMMMMMIRLIGR